MEGKGVASEADFEYKRKLGLDFNANFSFFLGVHYPLPVWYENLSTYQKRIWFGYRKFGDLMTLLLFISNFIMVYKDHQDIRVVTTCIGTMTYIICFAIELLILRKQGDIMNGVLDHVQNICRNIDNNPVQDKGFFHYHERFVRGIKIFGIGKELAIVGGVTLLGIIEVANGYIRTEDRTLPMAGWFPYDPLSDFGFILTCLFQLISYLSFLLKDVAIDLLFLTVLISFKSYLIYLRKLLHIIIKGREGGVGAEDFNRKRENLVWWIKQHQLLLRTIEEFKIISNSYLLAKYISVAIILFFGGVLVTSDISYDLVQQMIVLSINTFNLIQLYIFSVMGDEITENALQIAEDGFQSELMHDAKNIKMLYFYTLCRSKKAVQIRFGSINPLSVHSFGQIVKMCFSYFTTVVQLRSKT